MKAAAFWPKAGDSVSMGSGGKQQVWRDIAAADAASIEVGMRLKVDRKGDMEAADIRSRDGSGGDGASCVEATVVKADAGGGTWEVEYEEGGEKEGGGQRAGAGGEPWREFLDHTRLFYIVYSSGIQSESAC